MSKLARDNRNTDLAIIHIGKKFMMEQLGNTEADYRAMLWTQGRVESSAKLDFAGRKKVIDHLKALGFQPTGRGGAKRPVKRKLTPKQRLMWSLWQQLADAGEVKDRQMAALMAYVTRQTSVQRLEWLKPAQEDLVIESLKKWLGRATAQEAGKPALQPYQKTFLKGMPR